MPPITATDPPSWPIPKVKVRLDDLDHKGVDIFFDVVKPRDVLHKAVIASFKWLYTPETAPTSVEEILLVLRPMGGVADTTGADTHKEIHFSLDYILSLQDRAEDEIAGVLVHEVVHCFQHDAKGTCNGGLLEGIADYVRLNEGYAPPHWKKRGGSGVDWDAGFDTTAYFLDWIEKKHGEGTIRKLNGQMKDDVYSDALFLEITGATIESLWEAYGKSLGASTDGCGPNLESEPDVQGAEPLTEWPIPKFQIRVEDLDHESVNIFYEAVKPKDALRQAVMASFNCLYTLETVPTNVKQILLVLRSMGGVAHTTGSASHKEIHFSLDYIKRAEARARDEIMGVLVHEVVHCFQHTGRETCPGGLIEGLADFVRLGENLGPPHWRQTTNGSWDAGYERTAYFLDWIEASSGKGTIRKLNDRMRDAEYDEAIFKELTGSSVDELWGQYSRVLKEKTARKESDFTAKNDDRSSDSVAS